ncbi:MAG: hypothetical protein K6E84_07515 [Lachnospiraceae bacterium]|nr:hypothetical protein [Lachnospiraceae bacterium]
MSLYLVDYENTGVRGIAGIEGLRSTDRLIILYGPKTGSVPFEDMVKMTSSPAAVEFIRTTKTAKNYLDFQLTTYLGYLVAQRAAEKYYIISRDSGFDSVLDFWQEKGIRIERYVNLSLEAVSEADQKTAKKTAGKKTESKKDNGKKEGGKKETAKKENKPEGKSSPKKDSKPENKPDNKQEAKKDNKKDNKKSNAKEGNKETKPENKENKNTDKKNTGNKEQTVPESIKKKVRNAMREDGLQPGAYRKLYTCMLENEDKSGLNTALVHAFGQETANKYYKQILPAFTAWRSRD